MRLPAFLDRLRLRPWMACALAAFLLASCGSAPKRVNPNFPLVERPAQDAVYRIRTGDVVQVDVFQEPLMTMRQRVLGDGSISVALLGRVVVAGKTVKEAAHEIGERLNRKQLVNPQVTITVLAYSPRRFTVWGQVKTAGTYVIPPEEWMTLPEAIAMAGGNTLVGSLRNVVVSRPAPGGVERLRIDASAPEAQNFLIDEGDVIFVPETVF